MRAVGSSISGSVSQRPPRKRTVKPKKPKMTFKIKILRCFFVRCFLSHNQSQPLFFEKTRKTAAKNPPFFRLAVKRCLGDFGSSPKSIMRLEKPGFEDMAVNCQLSIVNCQFATRSIYAVNVLQYPDARMVETCVGGYPLEFQRNSFCPAADNHSHGCPECNDRLHNARDHQCPARMERSRRHRPFSARRPLYGRISRLRTAQFGGKTNHEGFTDRACDHSGFVVDTKYYGLFDRRLSFWITILQ